MKPGPGVIECQAKGEWLSAGNDEIPFGIDQHVAAIMDVRGT
jgi:hypothetical protein